MDYIKMIIDEHRKLFKNHEVIYKVMDNTEIIYWKDPKTVEYMIKYIFHGNNLFISGDCGTAVFQFHGPVSLESLVKNNLGYLISKLDAFCEDKYNFHHEKAVKEIREEEEEMIAQFEADSGDIKKEIEELFEDLMNVAHQYDDIEGYRHGVWSLYDKYYGKLFESEDFSCWADFGKRLNPRLIAYYTGLKMINENLIQNK